jgi:hypothetical protein
VIKDDKKIFIIIITISSDSIKPSLLYRQDCFEMLSQLLLLEVIGCVYGKPPRILRNKFNFCCLKREHSGECLDVKIGGSTLMWNKYCIC